MNRREDLIVHGDVYAGLNILPDESVAVAITSPPYWRQRDYGFQGQIGQEKLPEEYIGKLVKIFDKLREKLRRDGVFFLNVGDKYLDRYGKSHLLQIPYKLAYHMVKNGWVLLDIIMWYKPNHMPSSVRDRFTNTYEPVMVFGKSSETIYTGGPRVVKIPLQQTPWRHTAVFPEKLVEEMLRRVRLESGDFVLDPFSGTGTVGAVVREISGLFAKKVHSILIEKGDHFLDIIRRRTGIENVMRVEDAPYDWEPVQEERLPEIEPLAITTERYGEVYIADSSSEFLSALRGMTTRKFRSYHREDALYFFGVRQWTLEDLYYPHSMLEEGYVLRNMLVVSQGGEWFPVFMFASDSTKVAYRFHLDRVRLRPATNKGRDWWKEEFIGMKVRDISGKDNREGVVVQVLERYIDGFPMIAAVKWNGESSLELVLHPSKDELVMEGLIFKCPACGGELEEPYDPAGDNVCPHCGAHLWTDLKTVPRVEEPPEIVKIMKVIESLNYMSGEVFDVDRSEEKGRKFTRSKFTGLDRLNWGASPGARKLILGEYFTKMRLYRIDHPVVARYLTLLRRERGMTIQDVVGSLPSSYLHTVGHWFREDFGGSIPVPQDIPLIKRVLKAEDSIFSIIERTALKFQTVKASVKGRNPGDFLEPRSIEQLVKYLRKLYLPSSAYLRSITKESNFVGASDREDPYGTW